ncbi:MAG: hypothetical protein J1E82_03130 [Muribaculaceae bacterium]|nr:hypothetical protein [Muribaculaceae bacterium]
MKKLPPIEKVFEAWTALADHRIKLEGNEARVSSSDGEKSYSVKFAGEQYSSDDNATFWQGYAGYPVIALLMIQGRLPYDEEEARLWKNINWTQLNKQHKNRYAEAVAQVAGERDIDLKKSYERAEEVLKALSSLPIEIKRKIK